MIKVNILNRQNLTMLAKAYMDKLIPYALDGEVYFSNNEKNEIQFIYYENHNYYFELLKYIDDNITNFDNSNAANEWYELFSTLKEYSIVENVDFGFLESYSMPDETNTKERAIDMSILETKDDSFYRQVKRLYRGYNVEYWGEEKNIVIRLPIYSKEKTIFNLYPLIQLLDTQNKKIKKFDFLRDPITFTTVIRIFIE